MKEKFYEKDGQVYEDEIFSNPKWEQLINDPTTYSTPRNIAKENIEALGIESHHIVLEPACGVGEYLYHCAHAQHVDAVELHSHIAELINAPANTVVHNKDFLTFYCYRPYDRIICSPPLKEIVGDKHLSRLILERCWWMLNPGGKLLLNYRLGDEGESLKWLEEQGAVFYKHLNRPNHRWHNEFQNAVVVGKP